MPSVKKGTPAQKTNSAKPKVLIFVLAYNAEKFIFDTLERIPKQLDQYDTTVLIIDDASPDKTSEAATAFIEQRKTPFEFVLLKNNVNQGFGGNCKVGFQYAIKNGFDFIALTHGDGQYAPEVIPKLLVPLINGEADKILGSRMMRGFNALKGGMPLYKFIGNKVLSRLENKLLSTNLSEFHTGQRLYSVEMLKRIPYHLNSNGFHFDTEIIIQHVLAGARIKEFPIDTRYGKEVSHVPGMNYAWNVVKEAFLARMQLWGICYQRKYDIAESAVQERFRLPKTYWLSEGHKWVIDQFSSESTVAEISSSSSLFEKTLRDKGCKLIILSPERIMKTARDHGETTNPEEIFEFSDMDAVLLVDVLGSVGTPEIFLESLHRMMPFNPEIIIYVTSPNIGFILNRIQFFFGYFNYGKRGILNPTYRRLFTKHSLSTLLEQARFSVNMVKGFPAPFERAFGGGFFSRSMISLNKLLIMILPGLFSHYLAYSVSLQPSLDHILSEAKELTPPTTGKSEA